MYKKHRIPLSLMLILLIFLTGCNKILSDIVTPSPATNPKISENVSAINTNNPIENGQPSIYDASSMEVHFIDVGQGDCTLIMCEGQSLLIDAGNNNKGTAIQLYLKKQGISNLDYVIGTHPDSDHIGGLDVILYKFNCKTIILSDYKKNTRTYDDVLQAMKHKRYKNTIPVLGNTYTLGSAKFTIITPNNDYGKNANDYSVGILLQHGKNKFIFTGDSEEHSENDIRKNGIDISAKVYKVSHHGSNTASTQPFLNAIKPEYAVISCGRGNSYGHPHKETLARLRALGVEILRTDKQGSIIAASDRHKITWNYSPSNERQSRKTRKSDKEVTTTDTNKEKSFSEERTYIINTNTKKFHYASCLSIKKISTKNRLDSMQNREELINQRYLPCGYCKP